MSITQTVIVINDGFEERQRTTSVGTKSRYTISVQAEPILHEFSEERLGEEPARAIAEAIRQGIKNIVEVARPATLLKRTRAKRELERGTPSAVRRYSGGRTGLKEPSGSVRLYNDSGRLADGLEVRQNTKERSWTINVPANRLDPSTFKSRELFVAMVERLRELVPVLRNPFEVPEVVKAIRGGIRDVLIREMKRGEALRMQRARAVLALFRF